MCQNLNEETPRVSIFKQTILVFSTFLWFCRLAIAHCVGNWYKKWWNGQVWLRVGLECSTHAPCIVKELFASTTGLRIRFFLMIGPGSAYLFRFGSGFSWNTKKIKFSLICMDQSIQILREKFKGAFHSVLFRPGSFFEGRIRIIFFDGQIRIRFFSWGSDPQPCTI